MGISTGSSVGPSARPLTVFLPVAAVRYPTRTENGGRFRGGRALHGHPEPDRLKTARR